MPEDTETKKKEAKGVENKERVPSAEEEEVKLPPLEAAARRLEKLLKSTHSSYINPAKVVRRWPGTASGAAGGATLQSIGAAASVLLNPDGVAAEGKAMLSSAAPAVDTIMSSTEHETETILKEQGYLSSISEREVEVWLLSLLVRIYWKEKNFIEAFQLSQQTINIILKHFDVAATSITSASRPTISSLFPLLARMYRYRSLVVESLDHDPQVATALRHDMIKAHGLASLRRDVDSQATLLNLMLRDLLNASQGKLSIV
jgi:hypothetical protein